MCGCHQDPRWHLPCGYFGSRGSHGSTPCVGGGARGWGPHGQWPGWPCGVKGEKAVGLGRGTWARLLVTPPDLTYSAFACPFCPGWSARPAQRLLASSVPLRSEAASFCLSIPRPCSLGTSHHLAQSAPGTVTCPPADIPGPIRGQPSCAGCSTDGGAKAKSHAYGDHPLQGGAGSP